MCGWARRLEDGRGAGGGSDRSQVTGPPPPPPVWSPADSLFSPSAAALGYSSRGGDGEVEDGSEKPGSSQGCSRQVKAAGLGQEVGGVTLVAARFWGPSRVACRLLRPWVGFRIRPLWPGKGHHFVGPEQRQNCRERLYGRGTNCLGCPTRRFGAGCGKSLAHVLS